MYALAVVFRYVQRIRVDTSDRSEAGRAKSRQEARKKALAMLVPGMQLAFTVAYQKEGKSQAEIEKLVSAYRYYFLTYWLCDEWIECWMDWGLPDGAVRGGTFNTNNWSEAVFRSMRTVHFGNRTNKRIDFLVHVILDQIFAYYDHRLRDPVKARPADGDIELNRDAFYVWETNTFTETSTATSQGTWTVHGPQSARVKRIERHTVTVYPARCTCVEFGQTGDECRHLRATRWLRVNGPYSTVGEALSRGQRFEDLYAPPRTVRVPRNETDEQRNERLQYYDRLPEPHLRKAQWSDDRTDTAARRVSSMNIDGQTIQSAIKAAIGAAAEEKSEGEASGDEEDTVETRRPLEVIEEEDEDDDGSDAQYSDGDDDAPAPMQQQFPEFSEQGQQVV